MQCLVFFGVTLVLSIRVIEGAAYQLSVVPKYDGLLFTFDTEGRNMHLGQHDDEKDNKFIPKIDPSKCHGDTFCEEADHYPYKEVDNQLSQAGEAEYKFIFGIDEVELTNKMDNSMDRIDLGETNTGMIVHAICESRMKVIFPRIARNKNNQWKYVVNQGVDKVQGIAIEWCRELGAECTYLVSRNRYMIPTCGQKYSYRRLLSVSHDGVLESDIFEFPVACMCYLKSYLSR